MLFFKPIVTAATFALYTLFVVAAPAPAGETSLAQRGDVKGLAQIFADATTAVTPVTQKLEAITADTCTTAVIGPIVADLTSVLNGVISEVNGLAGQSVETILAPIEGTVLLTVSDLASIVSGLLHLVLGALGAVLPIAKNLNAADVISLLSGVGALLGSLVGAVLDLVGTILVGLAGAINGLLGDVLSIISGLNIAAFVSALGISI